jgi:hypothetical protein
MSPFEIALKGLPIRQPSPGYVQRVLAQRPKSVAVASPGMLRVWPLRLAAAGAMALCVAAVIYCVGTRPGDVRPEVAQAPAGTPDPDQPAAKQPDGGPTSAGRGEAPAVDRGEQIGGPGGIRVAGVAPERLFRSPRYSEGLSPMVGHVQGGVTPVVADVALGYIDYAGRWAIPPKYLFAEDFHNGFARVQEPGNDLAYYIDYTGRQVPSELVERVKFGLKPFKMDNGWGLIDPQTKEVVVEPKYYRVNEFSEGLVLVEDYFGSPGGCRWFDYTGREVFARLGPVVNRRPGAFHEGLAAVEGKIDGSGGSPQTIAWGFIDRTGKYAIEPRFDNALDFHEGWAAVRVGKKWGYIDYAGKLVIPAEFDDSMEFSEGLAAVRVASEAPSESGTDATEKLSLGEDGLWGFIDASGKFVIRPKYLDATSFSHGRAYVRLKGFQGFIDRADNRVLDTTGWDKPAWAK